MVDERLDRAERLGQREDPGRVGNGDGCRLAAAHGE